jgi:hypothetical protein
LLTLYAGEPEEIIRRRKLASVARTLLANARKLTEESWFRKNPSKTDEWRRGMELLIEANPSALVLPNNALRSPALDPGESIGETLPESVREGIVQGVIRKRSRLVAEQGSFDVEKVIRGRAGRILICVPEENVADGASQAGSSGFFDPNDVPPWDTWFHYSDSALFCWVPSVLVSLVENGIHANPVDCIHWADENELQV